MSMAEPINPPDPSDADRELEAEIAAVFERHFTPPEDPTTPPSDVDGEGGGGELPPTATPDPVSDGLTPDDAPPTLDATPPESDPSPGSSAPAAQGVDGAAPDPSTPTPSPSAQDEIDANLALEAYLGRRPNATEVESLLNLWADASALDQERGQYVSFLMQGGDPAQLAAHLAQQYQQPAAATPPTPAAQPTPPSAWDDDDEPAIPPQVTSELEAMRAEIAQQAQWRQQQELTQQAQLQQWYEAEASAGADEFAANAPVDIPPEHLAVLKVKANKSGLWPAFLQSHQNNPRAAYSDLLRYVATSDPAEAARWQQATVDAEVEARLADRNRQQLASSVSAGGNAAAAAPITDGPLSRDEARKGALDYLANVMNDGQPAG